MSKLISSTFWLIFSLLMLIVQVFFSLLREHVDLENLRGEHARLLEETKKEKVSFYPSALNVQ